ncbi:MAG: hypothetical protein P8J33_00795 [Pirellulaceae bacterium]|nr:hypothetical protein [Pirellulaceae bacterium]
MQYLNKFLNVILLPFNKIYEWIKRLIPGFRKISGMSPEWLGALTSSLFFVIFFSVFWLWIRFDPPEHGTEMGAYVNYLPWQILVAISTPILIFWFIRVLRSPPKSPYPDIDAAWMAGLAALRENGISPKNTPIYILLGFRGGQTIKSLMASAGRNFDFEHITAEGQALYWYGSSDAIYLVLSEIGSLTEMTKGAATLAASNLETSEEADTMPEDFRGTIGVQNLARGGRSQRLEPAPEPEIGATIRAADISAGPFMQPKRSEIGERELPPTRPRVVEKGPRVISKQDIARQSKRLSYTAKLLKRLRNPVGSLNGILLNGSLQIIENHPAEFSRQARNDLSTICNSSGLICAVTMTVSGWERLDGCRLLVDRLQEKHGKNFLHRRFGKGFRSWEFPKRENMDDLAAESVLNFDQYIYSIFQERDALSSRNILGNREMVSFFCRVYSKLLPGLTEVLGGSFVEESQTGTDYPRFSGCYFIGAGSEETERFFVDAVFDRLDENQAELEWTEKTIRREEGWELAGNIVFVTGLAAVAASCFLLYQELNN